MKCPNCGVENSANAKFCSNCGYNFSNASQSQPMMQQPAQSSRPWFKNADTARAAIFIALIIVIIELGVVASNISDIDNDLNSGNNDQNDSYIIHHVHKPKIKI